MTETPTEDLTTLARGTRARIDGMSAMRDLRAVTLVASALGVAPDDAGSRCHLCGPSPFPSAGPRQRVLGVGFSDWAACDDPTAPDVCTGCARLMAGRPGDDPPPLRMRSLFVSEGVFRSLAHADVWPILEAPPTTPFVLSWATSGQKHHVLRAGVSTAARWAIGTDDGRLVVTADDAAPVMHALLALRAGDDPKKPWCSRDEILSGRYRPPSIARDPIAWAQYEAVLAHVRGSLLLAFLVAHAPVRPPVVLPAPTLIMDDPIDTAAAALLLLVAQGSEYRTTHGKEFWGGVLARRVRRHAGRPLAECLSRLATDLQVSPIAEGFREAVAMAAGFDDATRAEISARFRRRTTLIVGLAYGAHQQAKEAAKHTTKNTKRSSEAVPTTTSTRDF